MSFSAIRERVAVDAVRMAPMGLYSEVVGWGARRTLPRALRPPLYALFARAVGAELAEVELPLSDYPTFGSFFARRLRADARPIDGDPGAIVSPCDGLIGAVGETNDARLIQAKGRDYRLADLLVDPALTAGVTGGAYVTIYLSPRDYHRVHAPCDAELLGWDYVPGELYPVARPFAEGVPNLFARNERLVFSLRTQFGPIAMAMVGAAGVGNMTIPGEGVETRAYRGQQQVHRVRLETARQLRRGEELACFELGSTVIAVFPPGAVTLDVDEAGGVRVGERIARATANDSEDAAA